MSAATALLVAFVVAGSMAAARRNRPARSLGSIGDPARRSPRSKWLSARPTRRRTPRSVQPAMLAAWSDDLARTLRHGATLHAALVQTLPTDPVIERRSRSLRHWLDRGATVADACDEWFIDLVGDTERRASQRVRRSDRSELLATMAAVLAAVATLGGTAAGPLDRFAVAMRQRASDDLERAAQSAQAKMSARVLTCVPLAVLVLLVLTDADVRGVITSATGGFVVALGLLLNTTGAIWMQRIARSGEASTC